MFLITASIIIFALLFFYKLYFSPSGKILEYGNRIPGPKAYPIIGNALCFFSRKNVLQVRCELGQTYGSVYRLWIGKKLHVVLSDPDDIQVFLTSSTEHLDKSDSYRFLDSWMGNTSLATSKGDIWKVHRKLLTPSFDFKFFENSVGMILRNTDILISQLEKSLDDKDHDIEAYLDKCTLDIICETAMSTKLETQLSKNTHYLDCVKTVAKIFTQRVLSPWLYPEFIFKISAPGRLYYKSVGVIKAQGRKVIQHRKKVIEEENKTLTVLDLEGRKESLPFLDYLLTKSGFSDVEIENEVQAFMFAGHDTVKTTISFCLHSLSQNADVQNKLFEEIKATFIDKEGQPTYQDYTNMKYLDFVIKETMRLYTTAPFFSRKVSEDTKIPSGYVLPAGSLVYFFIFGMHRNEHLYPDPERFLPERFEHKDSHGSPFAFIPFSAGVRNCIGQKFAMMEMRIIISRLLLKFEFLPAIKSEPLVLDAGMVIYSVNGLPVRIRRRMNIKYT